MTARRLMYPVLGRTSQGAWCDECALPSAISGTLYGLTDTPGATPPDGVGGLVLGHVRICIECGEVARGRSRVDD